jgi:cell division protein FtsB
MSYQEIQGHRLEARSRTDRLLAWGNQLLKGAIVLVIFGGIMLSVKQPLEQQNQLRAKVDGLKDEAEDLKGERDRLLRRLNWIQTDASYLELEVRDRLNLQKEGEFVLRFED